MSKSTVPYSWEEIEADIRQAVWCAAEAIGLFGHTEAYRAYVGAEDIDKETIDITKHRIHEIVQRCYAYAYQLPGHQDICAEDWDEAAALLDGGMPVYTPGEESPLHPGGESPIRTVLETFFARYGMNACLVNLSIRQLALLSGMTEPVVRASLSKEGYKLQKLQSNEGDDALQLSAPEALQWLSKRRGYIPNRGKSAEGERKTILENLVFDRDLEFKAVLELIASHIPLNIEQIAEATGKDAAWVHKFFSGEKVEVDLNALKAIAKELQIKEAVFVGRAVTHLLS